MFTLVEEGSFVALYSSSNSLELFIILKVSGKKVAEDDISDIYGHCIRKGTPYIEGKYLEKIEKKNANKNKIYYKELSKTVYIHPGEIFFPAVLVNEIDLSIDIEDYQFISDSL